MLMAYQRSRSCSTMTLEVNAKPEIEHRDHSSYGFSSRQTQTQQWEVDDVANQVAFTKHDHPIDPDAQPTGRWHSGLRASGTIHPVSVPRPFRRPSPQVVFEAATLFQGIIEFGVGRAEFHPSKEIPATAIFEAIGIRSGQRGDHAGNRTRRSDGWDRTWVPPVPQTTRWPNHTSRSTHSRPDLGPLHELLPHPMDQTQHLVRVSRQSKRTKGEDQSIRCRRMGENLPPTIPPPLLGRSIR